MNACASLIAAADHEDGVVAADRADDLRQPRAVDRLGQRLRLRRLGPQDDELLDDVELPQRSGDGAPEHGAGVGRHGRLADQRTLVSPVRSSLYEPQIPDVAGQRGLRDLDAPRLELLPELLLAVDRFPVHQLEHERLPIGLHNYSEPSAIIHSYAYDLEPAITY